MIAAYLLSAFVSGKWIADATLGLLTIAALLEIRNARVRRGVARLLVWGCFVLSLLLILIGHHYGGDLGRGAASIWTGVLLLLIVVVLIRQVLSMPEVTVQSIYGAISAYLIIGLMFSAIYSSMYYLNGRVFFTGNQVGNSATFQYFSFTTLTTLGYGDYTAQTNPGRAFAMLEAMAGQIFLATLVAKLVATFRPAARRPGDPAPDDPELPGAG